MIFFFRKNVKNSKASTTNKNSATAPQTLTAQGLDQSTDVWICLKCGIQGCGLPSEKMKEMTHATSYPGHGHFFLHYKTPRSDLHCIFLNLKDWTLFCFECSVPLYIDSFKRLREAVEVTKKMSENKANQGSNNKKTSSGIGPSGTMMTKTASMTNFNKSENVQKARGLNNLGNTCFFNSVMQCLNQSHYLNQILDQHCQKGAKFETPEIVITNASSNDAHQPSHQQPDSGMGSETSSLLQR